jgi:hypothetical protein
MFYPKFYIGLIVFVFSCFTNLQAQQVITGSGGNASGTGGTVSYSVGQVVYTTNTGTNGSVAQGVQQPYEISVATGIEEAKNIILEIVVYPNPATDFLKLKIENYEIGNLSYQLLDIKGTLLQNKKIESRETSIPLETILPATYLLNVIDGNKVIKTFKIIKN